MRDDTSLLIGAALRERAKCILKRLKAANLSIVTAESCTAGMIAAVLSRCEGAGAWMHGGFVTYTKAQKIAALGVEAQLLEEQGAVNEDVVQQLAKGALGHSPATISVAVSGVLGPKQDEDGNPVGLVYFCGLERDRAPIVVREDFGQGTPDELLRLVINRAFDLIEAMITAQRSTHPSAP